VVSKCANPECGASFLYLHQGKLFRVETGSDFDRTGWGKTPSRRAEYFWLCVTCAATMTIVVDPGGAVTVRAQEDRHPPAIAA
jgi:hypothetical protein